ncbi:MAG TPA: YjbQ family protein [Thermodesulforhabdus norvegica]|uniref:YjbQ family protein n=1 Tax=Thermodesulforhabdus norvegica TaxID=39841 RepID=A0A7C1AYH6_9BACT|nr:YjbQ family protein [Deltaproteobacteria bacterium]MBW2067395.1 YjbQ family protein [Deltaproteobacteria bacterium]HDL90168.1 YjbQ family protein [Thermodesulforhabdus norvegica]
MHFFDITVEMDRGVDIRDITSAIQNLVGKSGVRNGVVHITSVGSTGSVTTIEFEPGAVEDLKRAINELAPPDRTYEHEKAWHDGNGHSHVQSALLGPSLSVSIRDGRLALGTWQQIVLINHDIRRRNRRVTVTIVGIT